MNRLTGKTLANPLRAYRKSDLPALLSVSVAYAVLVYFVFSQLTPKGHVSMIWLPSGLGLAALLVEGKKLWPALFVGALAGYAVSLDRPPIVSIGIALGSNTLEPLVCVWLLANLELWGRRFDPVFHHPADFFLLAVAAAIGSGLAALVGCSLLLRAWLLPQPELVSEFLHWWTGNFFGLILLTPLLLVWRRPPRGWLQPERLPETLACFGLAFLTGQVIFMDWLEDSLKFLALSYWMFLFVAWAAGRFGLHGALLVVGMSAIQALTGALEGRGLFADDIANSGLANFGFYLFALTTVGMSLALMIQQRSQIEFNLRASEASFRTMNDFLPQQVWTALPDGHLDYVNQRVSEFFGLPSDSIIGAGWHSIVHPDDLPECLVRWRESLQTGNPYEVDFRLMHRSGEYRWCLAKAVALRGNGGAILKWYGTNTDITERKEYEDAMQLSSLVYQTSSEAMMVTDAHGKILTINPAFTALTGYTLEEILGKMPSIFRSDRQSQTFYQAMWDEISATGRWQGEIWDRRKDGGTYAVWLTINSSFNENGSVHRRIALFSDITEKKKSEEVIWRQANFDSLTGLPNRQMFHDRLRQEIGKAHRSNAKLALMFLDLDRFKEVNDTLGHDKGDLLLKDAAQRLSRCVREADTVARLGGDEFTVILGELADGEGVDRVAQDILERLAIPFQLAGEMAYVSASIGVTLYPDDACDQDVLIKNADQAMYAAKSQGRNRYSYFTPAMQEAAQARMRLANDLRAALAGKQFEVFYQPIVELATGAIHKAEALIRWHHPILGLINPNDFIPIAEDTGIIVEIGHWMFREAAQQASRWRGDRYPDFQVSVNKSPAQFQRRRDTHANWFEFIREIGLPAQAIVVEITEGLLLDANDSVSGQLLEFRDAGMQVAIDDFGTGHSSLSYLRKFDIDYLKIDRSFVSSLEPASDDMALCEAIIVMAHKLGIKVIAEGVETEKQGDLLAAAGCDYAQGYFYSRPVPAAQFSKLL